MNPEYKIYELFGHLSDDKKDKPTEYPNLLISKFYPTKDQYFEEYTHDTQNNKERKDFINQIPDINNKCIISLRGNGSCVINALYLYFVLIGIEPLGLIENNNKIIQKLNNIVIDGMDKYYEKKNIDGSIDRDALNLVKEDVRIGNSPETPYVIQGIMEKYDLNITEYAIRNDYITNEYENPRNNLFPTLEYINSNGHALLLFPKDRLSKFLEDTDPTNYSRYANSKNSCFFAGLWAFMHKLSNPVIELLNQQPYISNTLSKYIIQYYNIIHSKTEYFNKFLTTFRNFLTEQENDKQKKDQNYKPFNWSNEQMDSGELIIRLFQEYTSNYNIRPTYSEDKNQIFTFTLDPLNLINKKYTLDYWYNQDDSFFGIKTVPQNYNGILNESILTGFQLKPTDKIEFNNERNEIILESDLEDFNNIKEISLNNTEEIEKRKNYKKKQKEIIFKPEFFYIYLNRNTFSSESGNIKDKKSYPITESYGSMGLYSIVVHSGGGDDGHYICYFRNGPNWYLFNDSGARIDKLTSIDIKTIEQNWVLLVYFKNQIPQDDILQVLVAKYRSSGNYITSQISQKYQLRPITVVLVTSLVLYLLANNEKLSPEDKDTFWLIGSLSIVISELVSPDVPIEVTVNKFIKYLFKLVTGPQISGGGRTSLIKYIIDNVTLILTEWYSNPSRSQESLKQIIQKFKSNSLSIQPQLNLTELVRTPEYTLSIIKSNKSTLSELNLSQQIQLLRSLKWKVNMTPLGPLLIDWDQWVKLLVPKEQIIVNKIISSNPWIKYSIQSYIYNINMNHSNLLNK
jgi:hypothetical protein